MREDYSPERTRTPRTRAFLDAADDTPRSPWCEQTRVPGAGADCLPLCERPVCGSSRRGTLRHHGQQWVRNISRGDGHFVHGGQPSEGIRNVPACVLDAIIQIGPGGNRLHEGKPGLHESRTHTCCPMDHSSDERRNAGSNKCCATCHWWRWQVGIGLCWSRSCARSDGGSSGSDVGYHAILQGKTQWRGGARIFFRRW